MVRLVQEARKSQGFDVSDRIELWWRSSSETADAIRDGVAALATEVLAVTVTEGEPAAPLAAHDVADLALTFWLRVVD